MSKWFALFMIVLFPALFGCAEEKFTDVSNKPEFAKLLGTRFKVVGVVDAYGIRPRSNAPVEYITLIPPPGIEGHQIGFRVPIEIGSEITVLSVLRSNRIVDPDMTFMVKLEGTPMPINASIRIDLFRNNEGQGFVQLNPSIYRPLEK